MIEKEAPGFAITGKAHRTTIAASFASRGLDTPEAAIEASVAWADLLDIPLIYVKEDGQSDYCARRETWLSHLAVVWKKRSQAL